MNIDNHDDTYPKKNIICPHFIKKKWFNSLKIKKEVVIFVVFKEINMFTTNISNRLTRIKSYSIKNRDVRRLKSTFEEENKIKKNGSFARISKKLKANSKISSTSKITNNISFKWDLNNTNRNNIFRFIQSNKNNFSSTTSKIPLAYITGRYEIIQFLF